MAMFLASQPYFFKDFDCKIFDARMSGGWAEILGWMGCQDADYYLFADGSICPDPNIPFRLVARKENAVVPPVFEVYNGEKKLNVIINGAIPTNPPDCGLQLCDNASLSMLCVSRGVLTSLLMAREFINDTDLLAPIEALGYKIFVDWTITPSLKWPDECRERGNTMLNAYGIWYTRVKRGLPV